MKTNKIIYKDLNFSNKTISIIEQELARRGLIVYRWKGKDIREIDDNYLINIYNFLPEAICNAKDAEWEDIQIDTQELNA